MLSSQPFPRLPGRRGVVRAHRRNLPGVGQATRLIQQLQRQLRHCRQCSRWPLPEQRQQQRVARRGFRPVLVVAQQRQPAHIGGQRELGREFRRRPRPGDLYLPNDRRGAARANQRQRLQRIQREVGQHNVVDAGRRARQHLHLAAVPAPLAGLPEQRRRHILIDARPVGFLVAPGQPLRPGQPDIGLVRAAGRGDRLPGQVNVKRPPAGTLVRLRL